MYYPIGIEGEVAMLFQNHCFLSDSNLTTDFYKTLPYNILEVIFSLSTPFCLSDGGHVTMFDCRENNNDSTELHN